MTKIPTVSISTDVCLAISNLMAISPAFAFVISSVAIKSALSRIFPVAALNSYKRYYQIKIHKNVYL